MTTEFAKAFEAGEDIVGKKVVCVCDDEWESFTKGDNCTVLKVDSEIVYFDKNRMAFIEYANDFEFKDVLEKPSQDAFRQECLAKFLAEADEENKRLREQLDGMAEINKQYEQQLFDMRMENARLELSSLRWSVFDCPVNRDIADKLLRKLADEQQDGVESF